LLEQAPHSPEYVPDLIELEDHVPVYIPEPEHPEDLVSAEDEAPIETYITESLGVMVGVSSDACCAARQPGHTSPSRVVILFCRLMWRTGEFGVFYSRTSCGSDGSLCYESWRLEGIISRALEARITVLETQARRHEWQRQDADDHAVKHIMRTQALEAGARVDTLEDTASRRIMATVNQGMSVEEIEQIVAQRVANAIEAIAIYESINQTKQRENKVVGNASNKRKWEGDQNGSPNQQQNKEHKVFGAHFVGPNYKKEYLGSLPLCNECKFHHIGLCAARCENCKWRGHQERDCRISCPKTKPRPSMAKLKAKVTCYECGELGHYKRDCPLVKFHNCVDKYWKGKAHGDSNATTSNINI
ncbi:putative reverse transcriptase domain-containing protein, partial [Tanacetum coccineum]